MNNKGKELSKNKKQTKYSRKITHGQNTHEKMNIEKILNKTITK